MTFIVNCEVYPVDVLVHFGTKESLLRQTRYFNTDELKDLDEGVEPCSTTLLEPSGKVVLFMDGQPKDIDGLAILQHEIFHCVSFVLEHVGIEHNDSTEEAYAYLAGYITKKIYQKIEVRF